MLGHKDCCKAHHHKFNIGDGHANSFCLLLSILYHDNELGDAIRLDVVLGHVQSEGDHVDGMRSPTVGVKVGHDFKCRDLHIESLGILQVVVPNLVDNVVEEFCNTTFGCLMADAVVKAGFVGGQNANAVDSRGVVGNVPVVEGEVGRPDKLGVAMVGFILGNLREDGHERMDSY